MGNIIQPEEARKTTNKAPSDYLEMPKVKHTSSLEAGPDALRWEAEKWYRVRNRSKQSIRLVGVGNEAIAIINADTARAFSGKDLQKIDSKTLDDLEGDGKINIRLLDYDQTKTYTIINLTSKRITIRHNAFKDREFFVPAFGSRSVNGKTLLDLDYLAWESQGLIQIDSVTDEIKSTAAEAMIGLTVILLGFFLVVSIPLAIFKPDSMSWGTIGIITLIGFAAIGVFLFLTGRNNKDFLDNLGSWLKLLPGITLILGTGIGLPIVIIYFYGDGQHILQTKSFELASLGRILQTGFIAIASMLPAFLFYLFGRQQVTKQKENFYREAMLLDPNVWSNNEAKNKYGPLLNSVFDTGNSPFSILLLIISTALLVNGWIITLSPIGAVPDTAKDLIFFFTPDSSPFALGFLGVYFFTINMIYRRYVRADLTPKTYAYITIRLLTTVVLVWVVSTLPQFSTGSLLETGLSAVAFTIGIFPESALTLIQDYVNKLTAKRRGQDPDLFSLTKLEGMNLYDQARLMEEGIENIENLAHHNLMELIVRTRIPTARLVDMFDQSILYLHIGQEGGGDSSGENNEVGANAEIDNMRSLLKSLGVRTATDLMSCRNEISDFKDDPKYSDVVRKLKVIIASMEDDEWLNYVNSWRENSSTKNKLPIDDPYKFYFRVTGIEISASKGSIQKLQEKRKTDQVEPPALQAQTEVIQITPN